MMTKERDVTDLTARREAANGSSPARCSTSSCSGEWFLLIGRPTDPDVAAHGAVTMTTDGRITGYIGAPHCADCGKAYTPPRGWHYC